MKTTTQRTSCSIIFPIVTLISLVTIWYYKHSIPFSTWYFDNLPVHEPLKETGTFKLAQIHRHGTGPNYQSYQKLDITPQIIEEAGDLFHINELVGPATQNIKLRIHSISISN